MLDSALTWHKIRQGKTITVGLRSATKQEIEELTLSLTKRGIPYIHKTKYSNGAKLPFNGYLIINPKENK